MSATVTRPAADQRPAPFSPAAADRTHARRAVHEHAGLAVLLLGTAVLYLWRLGDSGYANTFYSAAAQAGSMSWKALLFGSLDPGNAITVDKPPASLWLMGLSVRAFGLSGWSILVPQAIAGVASVGVLYATVRRLAGYWPALAAGALFALTPVAVLMFRFNNPDALLVLLLVTAAYAVTRAVERAGTRWLVLAGALVGLAFLTKMLQAFVVLPAFTLVYLVAAPTTLRRRLLDLLAAAGAVILSAGWWIALVELWPAGSRPYIGGSTDNSALELALGYNGLSRLTGGSGGGPGGGGGGAGGGGFGGTPGLTRLFNDAIGGEISWLLPAALLALVGGIWLTRRRPRTDPMRTGLLLWGGWLVVTVLVFSEMSGIFHPYYNVALTPAIAAVIALGGTLLWRVRHGLVARLLLVAAVAVTGWWSRALLDRTPSWHPELRQLIGAATLIAVAALLLGPLVARRRIVTAVAGIAAALVLVAGPGAYALATAGTPHAGSIPASGPAGTADRGGPGGAGGESANAALTALLKQDSGLHRWAAATVGSSTAAALQLASGQSVMAIGGFNGGDPAPTLAQFKALVAAGDIHWFVVGGGPGGGGQGGAPGGTAPQGAPSGGVAPPSGEFGGTPPSGGFGGGPRGSGSGSEIAAWVAANYAATTVGGTTVYDLTAPVTAAATS